MQFDYMEIFYKYGIYAIIIIGSLFLAFLARNHFALAKFQEMDDSDKLQTPSFEHMDSGVVVSDPDEEDDP